MKTQRKLLGLPKTVVFLGLVSFFNDIAGEAIYSVMPVFLTTVIGVGPQFLGLLEGTAESLSSVLKYLSGALSDRYKSREPFVVAGYGLGAIVRPIMGLVTAAWQVLALRSLDRVGKGIRTAPRDAWLASVTTPTTRGKIFGFHQAMDDAGAIVGPLLATLFLYFMPDRYRTLFLLTAIPGLLSIPLIFAAQRVKRAEQARPELVKSSPKTPAASKLRDRGAVPPRFKLFLVTVLVFTLGNSTDAFLLLRFKTIGVAIFWIPLLYAALHVVKMVSSAVCGSLSDRIGRRQCITLGWLVYALAYLGIASTSSISLTIGIFLFYGLYYGLTEGPQKAFVADLVSPQHHGSAYGLYNLMIGIGALPASLIGGILWQHIGGAAPFYFGAVLSSLAMILFKILIKE